MAVQAESLKSILYFSGLSPDTLGSIQKLLFEKVVERGDIILLEGEPAADLYFVVSGVVKLFKTSAEGKEQTLNIVRPGESINDVAIFDNSPLPASAAAMGPVVLYGISRDDLKSILADHPRIALNIIAVLAGRVRQLASLVEGLSFKPVVSRVARILIDHAGNGTGPNPRLTQQEMAAMAGTAREVVGRSLKILEERGVIRMEHHRIVIADRAALSNIAEATH